MLDHLRHPFLLRLQILLFLLFLVLFTLLRSHFLEAILLFGRFLPQLLKLFLLLLVVLLPCLRRRRLLAVLFAPGARRVGKLDANDLVDNREDRLEHFEGLAHGLVRISDDNLRPHEDGVLVVDLLVGHVQLEQGAAVLLQDFAHVLVDQLVCDLFVLAQHDEVVLFGEFARLLLVGRGVGHWQVSCAHWEHQRLEMFVQINRSFLARLLGEEELNGVGRRAAVVPAGEQNRDVHSEDVLAGRHETKHVVGEEAVAFLQVKLVKRVEAVLSSRCVKGELRPARLPAIPKPDC